MDYLIDSKLNDNIVLVKTQVNKALRTFEFGLASTGCRLQVRPLVGGKVLPTQNWYRKYASTGISDPSKPRVICN